MNSVNVWDIATRLFHWSIVLCLLGCWLTNEYRWIEGHEFFGYLLLMLLIFRLFWGVIGSTTARFSNFVSKPGTAFRYLKSSINDEAEHFSGHNPLGGWMVLALLSLLLFQIISGLYSNNDLGFTGPLADSISKECSDLYTKLHGWSFNIILAAVWLHIIAVFFYVLVKKDNLVKAMVTGKKHAHQAGRIQHLTFSHPVKALLCLAVAGLFVII